MKQFFLTLGGVFAGLTLFFIVLPVILVMILLASLGEGPVLPASTVLNLDLRGGLTDQASTDPLSALAGGGTSVTGVVLALNTASEDERVKGLLVRLPESGMAPAAADELAQAFHRFRASGKTIVAHSQGIYASGAAPATYQLAAAADEVWMQPGASFEAVGLTSEDIFFGDFFRRFGVNAEFEQREGAKSAVNPYLYGDYTPEHRASQLSWMNGVFDSIVTSVAASRDMTPEAARATLVAGPYSAEQALDAGLIDRLGQADDARTRLLDAAGANAELVDISHYSIARPGGVLNTDAIAIINVEGVLMTGGSGYDPLNGSVAGSDTISNAIRDAADMNMVKAILLRVSSPGGTDTSATQIAAAVQYAQDHGKPVIVSMGTYAASGGYWISAGADYIIAQPTTLTGSIGVYGGKVSVGDLADRFDVGIESLTVGGEYAAMNGLGEGFTPAQRAAYAARIDETYADFMGDVSRGRNIPAERVREIAQGQVWTGAQARRLGLVDELGGLLEAIDKAKELGGIDGRARLVILPDPLGPFEAIEQLLGVSATSARGIAIAGALSEDPRARAVIDAAIEQSLQTRGANLRSRLPAF